jgi:hypothetical protein
MIGVWGLALTRRLELPGYRPYNQGLVYQLLRFSGHWPSVVARMIGSTALCRVLPW